jgi:hypothetical protein
VRIKGRANQGAEEWLTNGSPARLKQLDRDLRSLSTYEAQLSSEIVYLHEATLGLINLDQNWIIEVFSIAAVLFLPPTLVGTIYGVNFELMPELKLTFGYPFALGLMVLSAVHLYSRDHVIGELGTFMIPVRDKAQIKQAIKTKIILEVSGKRPPPEPLVRRGSGGRARELLRG